MMRRVWSVLVVPLALVVPTASASEPGCEVHSPPSGAGLGIPQNIDFDVDNTVAEVLVSVHEGFLRIWAADALSLDMAITSVDGVAHFHGTDVVPLSSTSVFDDTTEIWDVVVPWTEDDEEMVVNDLYTVCARLVFGATPIGPQSCADFGPF